MLASILVLLITTGGLLTFRLTYVEEPSYSYIGEISIESQEEYHAFLDAIFVSSVTVNVLDIQPMGKDIPTTRTALWADYPSLPVVLGFDLNATGDPLGNLSNVKIYSGVHGRVSELSLLTAVICIIGYPISIGLWISRKGIKEVRHINTERTSVNL